MTMIFLFNVPKKCKLDTTKTQIKQMSALVISFSTETTDFCWLYRLMLLVILNLRLIFFVCF